MKKNRICELLSIKYPIIQAPMSWISDAVLAASVSEAGGLGVIGPNAGAQTVTSDVRETAERLREQIRKTKSLTKKPFGVNIMCFEQDNLFSDACVKVILEEGIAAGCLCGDHPERYVKQLKSAGIKLMLRPLPLNSVEVARKAEQLEYVEERQNMPLPKKPLNGRFRFVENGHNHDEEIPEIEESVILEENTSVQPRKSSRAKKNKD